MKAKGTRDEVKIFARECVIKISDDEEMKDVIEEEIYKHFERRGFITKPEWKQAYDDYCKSTEKWNTKILETNHYIYAPKLLKALKSHHEVDIHNDNFMHNHKTCPTCQLIAKAEGRE